MVSARPNLVVILSSGDTPDDSIAERVQRHGGVFLRKPFLPNDLIELIESGLANRDTGDVQTKTETNDEANGQANV